MKIDERVATYMSLLQNEPIKNGGKNSESTGEAVSTETRSDAVDISNTAVNLADEEARRERLNRIRQQLAEGSYNLSGKDVANKMLNALKN